MRNINILKYRKISIIASSAFILIGLVAFIVLGFNTGIDFGAGFSERVQIVPVGIKVSYSGQNAATLSISSGTLVFQERSASGLVSNTYSSDLYPTVADVAAQMEKDGLDVVVEDGSLLTSNLVSGFGFPCELTSTWKALNFATETRDVTIEDVRNALDSVGDAKVQTLGSAYEGSFQIRVNVDSSDTQESLDKEVNDALFSAFGKDNVVVMQSDFVGPKFSAELLKNSFIAIAIALALILVYVTIRFRVSYAISSLVALFHDVLAMLSLILICRLEVSSTTIAAVLTIIGYSLNNTIVIFDRVRENVSAKRNEDVDALINLSINQSLSRTLITSLTTLFAIVPLAIFSSGDIKLFAINLTWGILVGGYSSNFIAPAFLSSLHKKYPINVFKEKEDEVDPLLED
ncbi:MAG: protein translocase subunit SecF [Spirochaetales bacterium]|nr:protein translocase subunit SecF [Spirochaetales bacterium]